MNKVYSGIRDIQSLAVHLNELAVLIPPDFT